MLYDLLKVLHLFSVILFLGNVITGLFWMQWAVKSRNVNIVHHTIKGIIRSDLIFTLPSATILSITGLMMAMNRQIPVFHSSWVFYSIILFLISGIVYAVKVVPLQLHLRKITGKESKQRFDWNIFR